MSEPEQDPQAEPGTEPAEPTPGEPDAPAPDEVPDPNITGPLEIPTPLRETDEEGVTGPTTIPDEDDDGQGGEPQEDAEQARPEGMSEKEIEVVKGKLRNENKRHRNRLTEIMGDGFGGHVPCPMCTNGTFGGMHIDGVPADRAEAEGHTYIDGWIVPPDVRQLTEDQRGRTLQLLGLDSFESLPEAPWAMQCPTCLGYGKVKTGSRVPERETTKCADCDGAGWTNAKQAPPQNGEAPQPVPATTGPTVYGSAEPDSRVLTLREEGWTVFPPVHIAGVD